MKWLTIVVIVSCLFAWADLAHAEDAEPFAELKALTLNGKRWGIENYRNAEAFNAERDRLGGKFVRELLKFVGSNPASHYWCGTYLTDKAFLKGKKPMRFVATSLWEQGLILEHRQSSRPSSRMRCLHELLAVEYERNSMHALASFHKSQAETLRKEYGVWGVSASEENNKAYKKIAVEEMPATIAERVR